MRPEEVKAIIGDTPFMSLDQAQRITEFIHLHRVRDVLELGFAHGASTCYLLAALEEGGGGSVVTIDLQSARNRTPHIEQLVANCSFGESVKLSIFYEPTSFTWRLMKMLEAEPVPTFDFCYLDAGHNWATTGYGFLLVDRLLRPGGWVIFDDIYWTYATSPTLRDSPRVQAMPQDERETPQVKKVFDLLVIPHPNYTNFRIEHGWGFAQKKPSA
jgi:predicted O-methyltransferase YrrM